MITRINITIDEDLLNKIDSYSKKRYLSRSGLISAVLSGYLDTVEQVPSSSAYALKPTTGSVSVGTM